MKHLKCPNIRVKMLGASLFVITITIIAGFTSINGMNNMKNTVNEVLRDSVTYDALSSESLILVNNIRQFESNLLVDADISGDIQPEDEYAAIVYGLLDKINRNISEMIILEPGSEQLRELHKAEVSITQYQTVLDETFDTQITDEYTTSDRASLTESYLLNIESTLRNIMVSNQGTLQSAGNTIESSANSTIIVTNIGIVIVAILGIVMALFITRGISRPLIKIKSAMQKIAGGNITEKIDINGDDEIGIMARAYNEMQEYLQDKVETAERIAHGDLTVKATAKSESDTLGNANITMVSNLRVLIGAVTKVAENIATASEQLSIAASLAGQATQNITVTSQQVANGANDQSSSLHNTSKGIDQLSRSITQISKGAREQAHEVEHNVDIVNQVSSAISQVSNNARIAADGSHKAGDAAQKGADMTHQTVDGMRKIKDAMEVASKGMTVLGEQSSEISQIVATIDEIAAQTNLLALNAAIEAARAGDQGRGFAVVADEVRKLAERSTFATKEIAKLVTNIQSGVDEAIKAIDYGNSEVNNGYDLATNAGDSLSEILETVMEVGSEVGRIANASSELSVLSEEMVRITDNVSDVVEQNTSATEEMADSADDVRKTIEDVANVAKENSTATQQVFTSAEEMRTRIEEVILSALSLEQMSEELRNNVRLFQIPEIRSIDIHE